MVDEEVTPRLSISEVRKRYEDERFFQDDRAAASGVLQKLPEGTRHALEFAACIGNRFQLASLAIVREQTPAETAATAT